MALNRIQKNMIDQDFVKQVDDQAAQLAQKAQQSFAESIDKRVDELVIGSGDANAEVTDAHVSTVKNKTFTTLSNRMEESEMDTHFPVKNLITNGDFSDGKNGWTAYNALTSALNNTLTVENYSNGSSSNVKQTITFDSSNEKKVYIKALARVTNSVCNTLRLLPEGTSVTNPIQDNWYELEALVTSAEGATTIEPMLDQRYADTTTATGKIMEVQNVITIDLTATFGAGNEPSMEWLKSALSKFTNSWFDGANSLFNGKKLVFDMFNVSKTKADVEYVDTISEASKFEATNIVSNGDFSNGTTGWSIYNSTLSASNNILSVKNFSNGASSQAKQTINFELTNEKKIYIRAFARVTNDVCDILRLLPDGTSISKPVQNSWYELTSISTLSAGSSSIVPTLEQRYVDTATAIDKTMEVKYVLAIDLTSAFGVGNEPTIEEMNDITSKFPNNWFSVTGNLFSAKKVVSDLAETGRIARSVAAEYEGLKWGALGDSITATTSAYHKTIGEKLGVAVTNYGENGVCIGSRPSISTGLAEKYTTMSNDLDIITVFAGTNDARTNDPNGQIPLGTMSDRTVETFYGACHILYKGLIEKFPGKRLGVITPIPHETNWDGTLESYANASKEVAYYYSIPVLDLFHESGLNAGIPIIKTTYVPDGLHPNEEGHKVIARRIESFIKSL